MWEESRIIINHTLPSWGSAGNFMGSTNFIPEMWLPDIQIYMCKQFRKRQIVRDVAGLIIFKNRNVLYQDHRCLPYEVQCLSVLIANYEIFWLFIHSSFF
jgi:hypothetical protein